MSALPPLPNARRPWFAHDALSGDFVAFDTETTGLGWRARLVEVAAVRFRGDEVIARWSTLVDPRQAIPARVIAIHGIDDAMVRGAPRAPEAIEALRAFSAGATMLAHHARFDRDILGAELARAGRAALGAPLWCTLAMARRWIPEAPRHGLARLSDHLGLGSSAARHRAAFDAELTRRVFIACAQRAALCEAEVLAPPSLRFDGGPRALTRRRRPTRALHRAARRGARVTLTLEGEETLDGVITALLQRHGEVALELRGEHGERTVALAGVASLRRVR